MKIKFDFVDGDEHPYKVDYEEFNSVVNAKMGLVFSGYMSNSYTNLMTMILKDSSKWGELPELEFSDYYDQEIQDLTEMLIDSTVKADGLRKGLYNLSKSVDELLRPPRKNSPIYDVE